MSPPRFKRKQVLFNCLLFLLYLSDVGIFQLASSEQQESVEFVISHQSKLVQEKPRSPAFTRKFTMLGNGTLNQQLKSSPSSPLALVAPSTSPMTSANFMQQLKIRQQQQAYQQQQQQQQQLQQQQQYQATQKRDLLEKICMGTSYRLQIQHNKSEHYQNLLERYQNCTYVIGNLEITWLSRDHLRDGHDLSFLESIREITGYLLIAHVDVDRIRMPNLQIIRGRDLFKFEHNQKHPEEFALILIENQLRQLELPNLREILLGSFGSYNNRNLCHIRTINWDEILNQYKAVFVYDGTVPECPACEPSCQGYCWGPGAEMCQKFSKTICSPKCGSSGRCFGPSDSECCHSFCAGGCTGRNQTDCLACRNFYNDGVCVQECPHVMRYNPTKFIWEPNPLGKYAFGATCVRECPESMLKDSGACVRACPPHKLSSKGKCAGPDDDEFVSCQNYKAENYCVTNCSVTKDLLGFLSYEDPDQSHTCKRCHPECRDECSGPEARHCKACKNFMDNNQQCVSECPISKYKNHTDNTCQECNKSCGPDGCTGPSSGLGDKGCNSCAKAIIKPSFPPEVQCIPAEEPCPEGYYQEYISTGRPVCRKCHHKCKSCIGMGTHRTVCECAKFIAGEDCEDTCPRDYFADEESRQCLKCSPECNGCTGPTEADCISCRAYRIYQNDSFSASSSSPLSMTYLKFNCTAHCPTDKPFRIRESNMLDLYCSEDPTGSLDHQNEISLFNSTTALIMLLVVLAAVIVCLLVHRDQMEKDKKLKLTMHLSGFEDVEPLTPSHLKPNLAPLRSIKEFELRKGRQLGSGFGGTVYQGLWYPEGQEQNDPKPVAIKVLHDNSRNREFLDEAYFMASVNHPNLVRLLAVCMTQSHLMLVTQLMPFGCLLDYVRKHRDELEAKNILEWGKQIARGMAYLEENRMVHRDLALRNVLLQTPGRALISDFGLAKLLELDQSEYQSGEGRLPIKWLAPECLRKRKFTHKSDVWAFGVTVWELVTFGQKPFEEYDIRDVPLAIEKGARLHQPGYVTTELYKVMYACWFPNPEDRPDFQQLAQHFVKFARDPERFIALGQYKLRPAIELIDENNNHLESFDDDDDEEEDDDDVSTNTEDEEINPKDMMELSPTTTIDFSQQATPNTLLTHQPNLTPSTHNRLNTIFGFDLQQNRQPSNRSHASENVNTPILLKQRQHMQLLEASNLMSNRQNASLINGLSHKTEQPTDAHDYLLPSHFDEAPMLTRPTMANHANVINEEYFSTQASYVNDHHNISNGNIPQSLI